ncbi:poly(3-hydroxybutyrate) depolymerase-like [Ylistrum balloti]|uniref:poly(3-hydroxybutyrate) depolymerase-like n=1 Tax=Ylistrum balloti TaxID=509963 RepID=UPI002905B015|nr:poly(3-hydroxybutyrate) depolymerase-like [Ylistrum balloti]
MKIYLFCLFFGFLKASDPRLETYDVGGNTISISGISSGAAMATQMHVINSERIMGAGIIAGVPFACSGGTIAGASACMLTPSMESVTSLELLVSSGSFLGNVDSTSNLRLDKVYIFSGTSDSVVKHGNGPNVAHFYQHYISDNTNIKTVFDMAAEHCMPTDNYGGRCDILSESNGYLNNCGYSAAYDLLNHIYGGNLKRTGNDSSVSGNLLKFDQTEFFHLSHPSTYSMDNTGYVYVPEVCSQRIMDCRLHVALHGCGMGRKAIGEIYVRHAGYNEVAEINNVIILYPQVISTLTNPKGCWDWWGYTGAYFATKHGVQITALRRMIERVSGY